MHHAFAVLHLPPHFFWAMTPREFAAALPQTRTNAMPRTRLAELMRAFPDRQEK